MEVNGEKIVASDAMMITKTFVREEKTEYACSSELVSAIVVGEIL